MRNIGKSTQISFPTYSEKDPRKEAVVEMDGDSNGSWTEDVESPRSVAPSERGDEKIWCLSPCTQHGWIFCGKAVHIYGFRLGLGYNGWSRLRGVVLKALVLIGSALWLKRMTKSATRWDHTRIVSQSLAYEKEQVSRDQIITSFK
ncbi:Uncharacterized protein Fot_18212 [Forsythia ovata]|uniref:Uncharacterized protein n=1 Tax=Forsythia ovata TaxID=205694 RepID=A0ABD1VHI6_9LAMI